MPLDAAAQAVTLLVPLPMVITANAAVGKRWAHHAIGILAGFTAGATFLFAMFDMTAPGNGVRNPSGLDIGIMVTAAAAATLASKPVRERLARFMPIDPDNPVHSYALVLAVILLGTQVSALAFSDVLAVDSQLPPLSIGDLAAQEAPFLILAFAGVGLYVRRTMAVSSERLGVTTPVWWQMTLALGAAGAFWQLSQASDWLGQTLTPDVARRVGETSEHLFGALVSQGNPLGIAALALLPGICEEVLFRGALQPRLGLLTTAVLFTAIHTEYGLSFDVVTIFVLAVGLGLIRRYANTTASITAHSAFNLLGSIQLTGSALIAASLATALLIAVTLYAIRRQRAQQVTAENEMVR